MIPFLWNTVSSHHHSIAWKSSELLAQTLVKRGTVFEGILPAQVTHSHKAPLPCKISYGPAFVLHFFPNAVFYISFNRNMYFFNRNITLTSWKAPKQLPTDPSKTSHGVWAAISQSIWRKWNSAQCQILCTTWLCLLTQISPSSLGPGFTFRLDFHIYFCQVKPKKNKAMIQIYAHISCLNAIGFVQNQIFFSGWSNLSSLITFWCSQTVLLVKSLRYLGIFHY